MNITDTKIKIKKGDTIYTLLQKDEDSKIKIKYKDNIINIATKQDILNNTPNVFYKDSIKIYARINGVFVQLAVKEDIEYFDTYVLSLNNKNNEIVYDVDTCISSDNNISLKANTTMDEDVYNIDYKTETELNFASAMQYSLIGGLLSIRSLDPTKNIYSLHSNNPTNTDYTLNNISMQSHYSTLLYEKMEVE